LFYDDENRLIAVMTTSNVSLTAIPVETSFVYDGLGWLKEQLWWTNSAGGGAGHEFLAAKPSRPARRDCY